MNTLRKAFPPANFRLNEATVVVLAAGSTPSAMVAMFGKTSGAMIPVSGRPTIHWALCHLRQFEIRHLILAVTGAEERLPRFVLRVVPAGCRLQVVRITQDQGPGGSLLACLQEVPAGRPVLVVLGDTLFAFPQQGWAPPGGQSFVLTSPVQDHDRWCLANVNADGIVSELADKPAVSPGNWPALIGVYYLHDPAPGRLSLESALADGTRSLQISHALAPYYKEGQLMAYTASTWLDCGNVDRLASSRRRLLEAREFNSITVDDLRGTITKRSRHHGKFQAEINYYRLLPADIAVFFPRLVRFSLDPSDTFLTQEYYGYSTLSEIWAFEEFDSGFWHRVLSSLRGVMGAFAEHQAELVPEHVTAFYWEKTLSRVKEFRQQAPGFQELSSRQTVRLNGSDLAGWPELAGLVQQALARLSHLHKGCIIHGDFCFPNILFDPVSQIVKLIDPRGSFCEAGIFGDPRYDAAKLLHSIDGAYDYLIHDLFALERDGPGGYTLALHSTPVRESVTTAFEAVFGRDFDLREIRLIEGLLFISMCSLHAGEPQRQTAMFLTGLRILNDTLKP